MINAYCIGGSIVNGWGTDLDIHWDNILRNTTSLKPYTLPDGTATYASFLDNEQWEELLTKYGHHYTKAALLCIEAINKATEQLTIDWTTTTIVLATTKGDIDLYATLKTINHNTLSFLPHLAAQLNVYYKPQKPVQIISNACISGSQAIQFGASQVRNGFAQTVIACGVDLLTLFTLQGFQCLKALSDKPAKPFDKDRNGISLGEAASAIVLSNNPLPFRDKAVVACTHGITTNDANHISGPSRTGEGLYKAMMSVNSGMNQLPDAVSLHGTGTLFNDDMESIAMQRAGLEAIDCFGVKGAYGHTLGAAGVLESILSIYSLCFNIIPPTRGYSLSGTSALLNVAKAPVLKPLNTVLKCSSGFGGGNCALLFKKIND